MNLVDAFLYLIIFKCALGESEKSDNARMPSWQ